MAGLLHSGAPHALVSQASERTALSAVKACSGRAAFFCRASARPLEASTAQENGQDAPSTSLISRRSGLVALTATLVGAPASASLLLPLPAAAAGRRKAAVETKKKDAAAEEVGGFQAKLLESAKRKEAMKGALAARKALADKD
eukprot:TRINITY_DN27001_c0_g1_i1.p1 TRINITY_DN27001_c0_g1~~TRINITY_DN27001_c0_g1_i1.p1  ORF type:complete len:159 (-),score=37.37 TRINITY_DN27001_c0_g1_i1:548-979(-)